MFCSVPRALLPGGSNNAAWLGVAAFLGRLRGIFLNVLLDKLQQHVRHVLALRGGDRLEGVVKIGADVQIHSLYFGLGCFQCLVSRDQISRK